MRRVLSLFVLGLVGCARRPIAPESQPLPEFVGSFYENAQESIFFPCGVRMTEDGWWVRFADGAQADRIRYQYKGSGYPTSNHDVRVLGHVTSLQLKSPIRYGTGFHTRELVIEKVLEVTDPGGICATYEKNPPAWKGAGPVGTRVMGAAASDDKSTVAIMEQNGDVTLWHTRNGELVRRFASGHTFPSDQGPDVRMWFGPQGTLLAEAGNDGFVRVWGVPDGELRWKLAHSVKPDSVRDSTGRVTFGFSGGPVSRVAFTSDGRYLVSVGAWRAFTWSMNTGQLLDTLRGVGPDGLAVPTQAVIARNPTRIIATGEDGLLRGYALNQSRPIFAARAERVKGGEMVISPDNRWIAILIGNDSVALWSLTEGRMTQTLAFPHFFNGGMTFSPDSKLLAISAGAGSIYIWDVATGIPIRSMHGLPGWAPRIWFNARGDSIVFTSVFGKNLYAVSIVSSPRFIRTENASTGRARDVTSLGPCVDTTSMMAKIYRDAYRGLVAANDPRIGIIGIAPEQVKLVGDTVACRKASLAFDASLLRGYPSKPVIVLDLGSNRAVIKDVEMGEYRLNVVFNRDFTIVVKRFGL